jgi:hypothetical protein
MRDNGQLRWELSKRQPVPMSHHLEAARTNGVDDLVALLRVSHLELLL